MSEALDLYRPTDRLMRDRLDLYCRNLVKIADKSGKIVPFIWNEAQHKLHAAAEKQLDEKGWVRAMLLKGRQIGGSTYVGARFYHKTSLWMGRRAYILTHEDKATQNLFGRTKLMHEHMPDDYKLTAKAENANELDFSTGSGYRVGTAHNVKGGGRSLTLQLFHGSEVAFWQHAQQHYAGVMQALPLLPETESWLESTANGVGGVFHEQWLLAEEGKSDYIPIFIPWMVANEYRRKLERGYEPSLEEEEYAELHGLDREQLCWMHFKNIELGGEAGKIAPIFRQEYPAIAAEAFQATGEDSLIASELVMHARKRQVPDQSHMPLVVGVDVARGGKDRTRVIDRQGRAAGRLLNVTANIDSEAILADRLGLVLKKRPDIRRMYIDTTGIGSGCADILINAGFGKVIVKVNYGAGATEPEKYANKRAEIWGRMKEWFRDPAGVSIPDDDVLHRHIAGPGYRYRGFDGTQLLVEPKEKIQERLHFSPDGGDALANTFAESSIPVDAPVQGEWWREHTTGHGSDWMTQ